MMILSRDLTLKSGAAKDARALAMTPGRGTPGTMRRSVGKRAGPVTSGVTTTARRQFGRPYFVPTMQRATPGILTLPSSS